MSDTNGSTTGTTEATETTGTTNRVEGKTGPKKGKKASRFARLWASARKNGAKGRLSGTVVTDEGPVKVQVQGFPATLEDEDYKEEAANSGLSATFPAGERELMGVRLKNGTMKFDGAGAVEFLQDIADSAEKT